MDGDSPCAEVIDPQHAADDIAAHAVKDQDLPDGVAIFIQDGSGMGDQTTVGGVVRSIICRTRVMVQIEKLLNRSYRKGSVRRNCRGGAWHSRTDLAVSEGHRVRHG